ncbi:signal peptidase II [Candidatus Bipolaricaulota bacterium]|nr:signal peptidase II [Candidatus Bipolaricaulota bacterium]
MGNLHYFLITLGVFLLDRGSKFLVRFGFRSGHPVFFRSGFFSIHYVKNSGGAFGLFPRKGYIFLIVTVIAVGLVIYLLFFSSFRRTTTNVGLALLLGGSLGNLLDRVMAGAVVDFIQIGNTPIFNFADVAIVSGSCLIIFVLAGGMKFLGQ